MSHRRLSQEDWLEAGMRALSEGGYESLGVTQLSKSLGVSKGSFYWHFASVGQYHDALLEHWHKRYISTAPREARRTASSEHPLQALGAVLQGRNMPALDEAIRRWAAVNPKARLAIDNSERYRRQRLAEMLVSKGVERDQAEARAQLVIWAWSGSADEANLRWRMKAIAELFGLIVSPTGNR